MTESSRRKLAQQIIKPIRDFDRAAQLPGLKTLCETAEQEVMDALLRVSRPDLSPKESGAERVREEGRRADVGFAAGIEMAANWLRRQANAESDKKAKAAFVEAHNAIRAIWGDCAPLTVIGATRFPEDHPNVGDLRRARDIITLSPKVGEIGEEEIARTIYEASRHWYPGKPTWEWAKQHTESSIVCADHYYVMARAVLALLRGAPIK